MKKIKQKYRSAIDFLLSLVNYEIKPPKTEFDFNNYKNFLSIIGHPHYKMNFPIVIAGTKGKGSTAHFLCAGLFSLNKKTGLYTSPHIVDIRERIRIDFEKISIRDFDYYAEKIMEYYSLNPQLTYFEALTTMAFLYFADKNLDYEIFEVGLGGRLDAVNVLTQKISILTTIAYDHERILGYNIEKIGREKAGIIKGGIVISAPQRKKVEKIIREICKEKKAELYFLKKDIPFNFTGLQDKTLVHIDFFGEKISFEIPLIGDFQAINSSLSALVLLFLGYRNFNFDAVKLSGRFEVLFKDPLLITDGAHNPLSIYKVLINVKKYFPDIPFYIIFGINRDKNIKRILRILKKYPEYKIIFTKSRNPRAVSPFKLKEISSELGLKNVIEVYNDPFSALSDFCRKKPCIVTGSFYLIEEVYRFFKILPL